ncbi:MAG: protein kinase [Acidobacteriota bacterium]
MNFAEMSGQTLDDKYRIERELGRGGMGTVYLATHLGTERPVAVKVIAPQFMERPEFVERFRREARAAGRLRHPNVVNVTDFGFSETKDGRVAYLVMEYLDGCTLGEILEEEKNLPVSWTLDILEQVCSAVQEAHEEGIIHRDLKPDNIWLEPNQRGGYTVKVLDFGIAKLETQSSDSSFADLQPSLSTTPTFTQGGRATLADLPHSATRMDPGSDTKISESATMIQGEDQRETRTAILPLVADKNEEAIGTQLITGVAETPSSQNFWGGKTDISDSTDADLTRVGAVLGTPLYMSPEQCRGEHLDPRSDVYSLGVIAYQMLSGSTPFSGDFTYVMDAHRELPPPPLNVKKVRKKLKRVIASALAKNPDDRPQTAEAFASILRSRSEGIFGLLRRALTIYTEHLPKFIGIAILLYLPFIIASIANVARALYTIGDEETTSRTVWKVIFILGTTATGFFCANLIVGTNTWLVNQILSYPLRPVRIKPALIATRNNWKRLIGTGLLSTALTLVGYALCFVPGLYLSVTLALVAPVVMMEGLRGIAALKRSKLLVMRSLRTTTAAVAILFFVPVMFSGTVAFLTAMSVKAFTVSSDGQEQTSGRTIKAGAESDQAETPQNTIEFSVSDGDTPFKVQTENGKLKAPSSVRNLAREVITSLVMLPFQVLLISLSSIVVALLYLKTRQAGGESMQDLMAQFEETDRPRKKWQERVRQRLIQSGRITGRS